MHKSGFQDTQWVAAGREDHSQLLNPIFPAKCQEIRRWRFRKEAIKKLEKILQCISLETMVKIIYNILFQIAMYGYGSWQWKKLTGKKVICLKCNVEGVLQILRTSRKTNNKVLDKIKPEPFLEANIIKLNVMHIRRQDSLGENQLYWERLKVTGKRKSK